MDISRKSRQKVLWIVALLVVLLFVSGCGGIKPYEPRDHREEGPEKGLFTGSQGEFVILRKAAEPKEGGQDNKSHSEPESTGQPEPAVDESGSVNKPPGDTS